MKKYIALICSVIMSCAAFAGCGNEGSDSSSTADSTAASSASDETASEDSDAADTYAEAYTKILEGKNFSVDLSMTSDDSYNADMVVEFCGDDYKMSVSSDFYSMDMYLVDSIMYIMDPTTMTYYSMEYSADLYGEENPAESSFGITEDYEFVSSEETDDGMICETYNYVDESYTDLLESDDSSTDSSSEDDTYTLEYKYYFEKESGDIKKIEVNEMGIVSVVTVNSFTTDITEITLPDLSEWTEESLYDEDTDYSDEDLTVEEEDSEAVE